MRPSSPSSISSLVSERRDDTKADGRPSGRASLSAASAISFFPSAAERQRGFSTKTSFPANSACRTSAPWVSAGVAIATPVTSASRKTASMESLRATPDTAAPNLRYRGLIRVADHVQGVQLVKVANKVLAPIAGADTSDVLNSRMIHKLFLSGQSPSGALVRFRRRTGQLGKLSRRLPANNDKIENAAEKAITVGEMVAGKNKRKKRK